MAKIVFIKSSKAFDVKIITVDPETGKFVTHSLTTRGKRVEDVLEHFQKLYPDARSIQVETIDKSEIGKYHA